MMMFRFGLPTQLTRAPIEKVENLAEQYEQVVALRLTECEIT